ncbi:MAG: TIM barrel protein [Candidatus Bathyarchaeia archaeon]
MYSAIRDFTVLWVGYKDIFAGLKDLGLRGFELYVDRNLKGGQYTDMGETFSLGFDFSTGQKRRAFIKELESNDLVVCAVLVENDFGRDDVKAEIKWVVDACRVASSLGVEAVRINSVMRPKPGVTEEEYVKRTAQCVREILQSTQDVSLAMENHGVIGNKREFLQAVLAAVNSERMGLTLDTGNFYWYGYPLGEVYKIIEDFASHVKHTHLKNLTFPEDRKKVMRKPGEGWPASAATLYMGDIDHRRIVDTLRQAGYDRDLTIEDESLGRFPPNQRIEVLRKDIEFVKQLI